MKIYYRFIPLMFFFLIITGHALRAAEHHVTTASGLQTALTTAQNNVEDDIIFLAAGTYDGPFSFTPAELENYSLTIKAESGLAASQVILEGTQGENVLSVIDDYSGRTNVAYHIEGVTLENGCQGIYIYVQDTDVTIAGNIIKNNTLGGCGFAGLYCQVNTGDLALDNNIIQDNFSGSSSSGTVYLYTNNGTTTITDNLIQNNGWGGIKTFNSTIGLGIDPLNPVKIINNIITDNTGKFGLYSSSGRAELDLINNTICNNGGNGTSIRLLHGDAIGNVYNNIIRDNESYDIENWNTTSTHYNAYNNNYHDLNGAWENHANNIDVNPKFISPVNGNYHLQSNSPCIDTGYNSAPSLPSNDFEGDTRTYDGDENGVRVADMGADEFVGPFPTCDGDFEPDGDVDGDDLADYIDNPMGTGLEDFALNFGKFCP